MSKIIAILPCRNSAWCLGLTARALLMWVDELHILLHACTDETPEIVNTLIQEFPGRIEWLNIESGIWQEMAHRNLLLESARANGATHIVTIDDDEVVTGNLLPDIRRIVQETPRHRILQLPWLQLRGGGKGMISTGMWASQWASCAFVDSPELHWKTYGPGGYDHHHRHPMGQPFFSHGPVTWGGLLHLQMASKNRLLWKHLWYKITERKRWPNKPIAEINTMYDRTVNECAAAKTVPVPSEWWEPYAHLMQHLHIDAEPWQKAEALRMLAEDPKLADGLTDYGCLNAG